MNTLIYFYNPDLKYEGHIWHLLVLMVKADRLNLNEKEISKRMWYFKSEFDYVTGMTIDPTIAVELNKQIKKRKL